MHDWIYITYPLHDTLEKMLVPNMNYRKPHKPAWSWLVYGAYLADKVYTFTSTLALTR